MGLMIGLREGTWAVWSDSDPRWNMEGRGYVGMLSIPPDAEKAILAKEKELNEKRPDDLLFGYMKD